jgi:5-methylcytosine-specific restriction enzyme A
MGVRLERHDMTLPTPDPRPSSAMRGYGAGHRKKRERLLNERPLCVACQAEGKASLASIRDHIVPLEDGGTDGRDNEQPLCETCHNKKTHQDKVRRRATRARHQGSDADKERAPSLGGRTKVPGPSRP